MAQKKQTEAKETTAPVKEQAAAKSKSGTAAAKKTTAAAPATTDAKPAPTTTKTGSATAKPVATKAAPADSAAKTAAPAKKAAAPKAATSAAPKKAATGTSASLTKVYGEIQASDTKYFIQKGSVGDTQLELVPHKDKKDLKSTIPSYAGQFVTVLGEFASKKAGDASTFTIHSLASHDEIARKAHELSHDNPAAVEENWFKAENELLK